MRIRISGRPVFDCRSMAHGEPRTSKQQLARQQPAAIVGEARELCSSLRQADRRRDHRDIGGLQRGDVVGNEIGHPVAVRLPGVQAVGNVAPLAGCQGHAAPARDVDEWLTWDAQVSYDWSGETERAGPQITLNVQNLFDEDPPFVNNAAGVGYDPSNADPLGRFVAVELRTRF